MGRLVAIALGMAGLTAATAGQAATVIVYADPMTLQKKIVVRESPGPDRAFLCMLPPSEAGCTRLDVRRAR
jgi:hypothetical protein